MRFVPLVLLAVPLVLAPVARADEDHPDCEEGQPWLVAQRHPAQVVLGAVEEALPADVQACEGEQWDGQDPLNDEPTTCTFTLRPEPLLVGLCMGADPNSMAGEDVLNPVGFRVSADAGAGADDAGEPGVAGGPVAVYASTSVALVGRVAVYADACQALLPGLAGDCGGSAAGQAGVYVRDNTPGNILIQLMPACLFSITGCYASESDCSYDLYRQEQESGSRMCSRDNTALGVGFVLP